MALVLLDESQINQANAITHAGLFHAADVFATVLLSKSFKEVRLCRVKEVPKDSRATIIYDIGGGKFDHHKPYFNRCRENGIKYSSFGLLWDILGDTQIFLSLGEYAEIAAKMFDCSFVAGIDALENGQVDVITDEKVHIISASETIEEFNCNEDMNENEAFLKAVEIATVIFDNAVKDVISQIKAVDQAIEKAKLGIMILENQFEWEHILLNSTNSKASEILYVISPSNEGGYDVRAVPSEPENFKLRKPFPVEWAGLSGEELICVTGILTATFCNQERFRCSAETFDDAWLLAFIASSMSNV